MRLSGRLRVRPGCTRASRMHGLVSGTVEDGMIAIFGRRAFGRSVGIVVALVAIAAQRTFQSKLDK